MKYPSSDRVHLKRHDIQPGRIIAKENTRRSGILFQAREKIKPGHLMEAEIENIGLFRNRVASEE